MSDLRDIVDSLRRVKNALGACLSIDSGDAQVFADMIDDVAGDVREAIREAIRADLLPNAPTVGFSAQQMREAMVQCVVSDDKIDEILEALTPAAEVPIPTAIIDALEEAAWTFEKYAEIHRQEDTEEGYEKAIANDFKAKTMRGALLLTKGRGGV